MQYIQNVLFKEYQLDKSTFWTYNNIMKGGENMVGNKLKELRGQKGYTITQLCKELEMNPNTYAKYERNERDVSTDTLLQLANFYDVTTDYLLGRDVPIPEYLTKSELAFENAIIERYKQLPEHFRKSFLQGVMETVEYYQQQETQEQPRESTMVDCGTIGEELERRQQETEALRKDTA